MSLVDILDSWILVCRLQLCGGEKGMIYSNWTTKQYTVELGTCTDVSGTVLVNKLRCCIFTQTTCYEPSGLNMHVTNVRIYLICTEFHVLYTNTLYIEYHKLPHKHGLVQDVYLFDPATQPTEGRSSFIVLPSLFMLGYPPILIITSHSL